MDISVHIKPRGTRDLRPRAEDMNCSLRDFSPSPSHLFDKFPQIFPNLVPELIVLSVYDSFSIGPCRGWYLNLSLESALKYPQHVIIKYQAKGHQGSLHRHLDQVRVTWYLESDFSILSRQTWESNCPGEFCWNRLASFWMSYVYGMRKVLNYHFHKRITEEKDPSGNDIMGCFEERTAG